MRRVALVSWMLILAASLGGGVWAAQNLHRQQQQLPEMPPDTAGLQPIEERPLAAGRIVSLDGPAGRVTIAHRGIGRFHIESGKTDFVVPDKTLLTGLTPGDKVRFDVMREGKQRYAITRLENAN